MRIGEQAPLESLLGAEGLSRLGAMVAVDEDGVLQGVVTLAQVRRALRPAAIRPPDRRSARAAAGPARANDSPPPGTEIRPQRPQAMPAHDVLIIGAGLAGQRAALAAARRGRECRDHEQGPPGALALGGRSRGHQRRDHVDDDWRSHAYDTVKGSDFLGDQDAIEIMCSEAPAEVMHLEHIGVTFHRNEQGEMDLRAFGGASMKRTAYVADITGQALLHVLYEQLMKHHETVERYEEWFTTSLLQGRAGGLLRSHCARRAQRAHGGLHRQERDPRLRRRRPGLQADHQRPDRDRRRHRHGLPRWEPL